MKQLALLLQIETAIEFQKQRLEYAIREKDNKVFDEAWSQLIQLQARLAELCMEELFKRGAS